MMKITKLTKSFGKFRAVNQLDLEISKAGLYILVGANGSGKSTLFNTIAGLMQPDSGNICIEDKTDAEEIRLRTGIAQEPFVTEPSLTVREIVGICCSVKKVPFSEAEIWLNFWELSKHREKGFKALSTGMKKRLSLALSLMGNPNIYFWDEPFNGLDPVGISMLTTLISELVSAGKTIVLSTHLLNEITMHEASFIVMKNGQIVGLFEENTPENRDNIINLLKEHHDTARN